MRSFGITGRTIMSGAMDVLTDVLRVAQRAQPRSAVVTGRAPWGIRYDGSLAMSFQVVMEGTAWLTVGADVSAPVRLNAGDVALLPTDPPHALADEPGSPTQDIADIAPDGSLRSGVRVDLGAGDGPRTVVLSGAYALDLPSL